MSFWQKLGNEIKELSVAMLYFGSWIGGLLLIKSLILAEYHLRFQDWSMVLIGALILAKVVLILEHVPLGAWIEKRPAWVDVAVRTALYTLGVFVVLVIEKSFEGRHEYGGLGDAARALLKQAQAPHVLANTIVVCGALLGYNAISVLQQNLGEGGLWRIFKSPLPELETE